MNDRTHAQFNQGTLVNNETKSTINTIKELALAFEERGRRLAVVESKVDEMLDILKFWRTLMRTLKGIGTGALFVFALIHYGHQVMAWLGHALGTPKK